MATIRVCIYDMQNAGVLLQDLEVSNDPAGFKDNQDERDELAWRIGNLLREYFPKGVEDNLDD